ncbi:MAG: hypothetical protein QMD14_02370 [Candidatus Aenigmarchaeota archaeon]|nr:hypothetical protein [Candidatus Aenigmarchaeota archaeon]
MCLVKIYNKAGEELMREVARYKLDVETKTLSAYTLLGEKAYEYKVTRKIEWDQANDSLIIE